VRQIRRPHGWVSVELKAGLAGIHPLAACSLEVLLIEVVVGVSSWLPSAAYAASIGFQKVDLESAGSSSLLASADDSEWTTCLF
jgi:hypothetical protein